MGLWATASPTSPQWPHRDRRAWLSERPFLLQGMFPVSSRFTCSTTLYTTDRMLLRALLGNSRRSLSRYFLVKLISSFFTSTFKADYTSLVIRSSWSVRQLSVRQFSCSIFCSSIALASTSGDHSSALWSTPLFISIPVHCRQCKPLQVQMTEDKRCA